MKKRSRSSLTSGDIQEDDLAKKRKDAALASSKSRKKKKMEFEALKDENHRLREETKEFEEQAKRLQEQVAQNMSYEDALLREENKILREAIKAHSDFIDSFVQFVKNGPTNVDETFVYSQGSDVSHDFLNYLLAKSQSDWDPLILNPLFPVNMQCKLWYKFTDTLFEQSSLEDENENENDEEIGDEEEEEEDGSGSFKATSLPDNSDSNSLSAFGLPTSSSSSKASVMINGDDHDALQSLMGSSIQNNEDSKGNNNHKRILPAEATQRGSRINIRLDVDVPSKYKFEDVCEAIWNFFKSPEVMLKSVNADDIHECLDLGKGNGNENSCFLFHRVKKVQESNEKDLGTVLLANRRDNVEFLRSTLSPPAHTLNKDDRNYDGFSVMTSTQKSVESKKEVNHSEMIKTTVIASSTTSLASAEHIANDVQPLHAIIVQGGIIFQGKNENEQSSGAAITSSSSTSTSLDPNESLSSESSPMTHAVLILSFPKIFRFHNLNYEHLLTDEGSMREIFGYLFQRAIYEFEKDMKQRSEQDPRNNISNSL